MKKSSNLFYSIGFVLNIIELVIAGLLVALFAFAYTNPDAINKVATDTGSTAEYVQSAFLVIMILFVIIAVVDVVVSVLVFVAKKNLKEKNGKVGTHILLLILGILSVNIFYLLGGIFGMVAASKDNEEDE